MHFHTKINLLKMINKKSIEVSNQNENVGFKCLHYSVTENNKHVEITIVKQEKVNEFIFGIRTTGDGGV